MKTMESTAGGALPLESLGPDVLPPGAKAGPWIIERELGRGGMGAVYAVVHEEIGKRAALKVVHRRVLSPNFNIQRVMLEAKVVNTVGHPNIVDIFETGSLPDGRPYIVMERLEGQPLSMRADESKILPTAAIGILLQVCDALVAAHAANVVHRDLKLDNVFLCDNADDLTNPKVKVLDWGIAKDLNHDVAQTIEGQLVGTPQYLSPEQARGAHVTPQSDVYSLGVMAYELFLEQLPFEADTSAEIMVMHLKAIPPSPHELWPDIPTQLETLLLRMLAKQPDNRPTMLEVARGLEEVRAELDRRRSASIEAQVDVVAIEKPRTIIRPPSAGLAPTLSADSAEWMPERKNRRWQYVIGAVAVAMGVLLFMVSRAGETQSAEAATEVPHAFTSERTNVRPDPVSVQDTAPAAIAAPIAIAPSIAAAPVVAPVEPLAARPTTKSTRIKTPPRKPAPAAPRRGGRPIDPNGTIDPW